MIAVPPRVGVAAAEALGADDVVTAGGGAAQAAMTSPKAAKPIDRRLIVSSPVVRPVTRAGGRHCALH